MTKVPEHVLSVKKVLPLLLLLGLGVVLVGVYNYSKSGSFFSVAPRAASEIQTAQKSSCSSGSVNVPTGCTSDSSYPSNCKQKYTKYTFPCSISVHGTCNTAAYQVSKCKAVASAKKCIGVDSGWSSSACGTTSGSGSGNGGKGGCGDANKGSCSSGTCSSGSSCQKVGSSCGCVAIKKK